MRYNVCFFVKKSITKRSHYDLHAKGRDARQKHSRTRGQATRAGDAPGQQLLAGGTTKTQGRAASQGCINTRRSARHIGHRELAPCWSCGSQARQTAWLQAQRPEGALETPPAAGQRSS